MNKFKDFISNIFIQLKRSITRFPETLALTFGVVLLGILLIEDPFQPSVTESLNNVMLTLLLGVVITATSKLIFEKLNVTTRIRLISNVTILLLLILYYFLLPQPLKAEPLLYYGVLSALFYLSFTLVPYFLKKDLYPIYILKLVTSFFVTMLYSLVIYLGIIAIYFAIDQLFNVYIPNNLYPETFIAVAGFFSVTYFLSTVPKIDFLIEKTDYPKVLRLLFTMIIIPILTVFTLILYAYFIKIVLGGEMPKGVVGQLVLWYGLISCFMVFFILPLVDIPYVDKFRRFFPFGLIIPLGMMFFALYIRISDLGITLARYYTVLAGIWMLGVIIYVLIKKNFQPTYLVLGAMLLLTLSAFGPLSAFNLTLINQNHRLNDYLKQANMLTTEGKIQPNSALDTDQQMRITSIIHYMEDLDKLNKLSALPKDFSSETAKTVLGFDYYSYYAQAESPIQYYSYYYELGQTYLPLDGYEYMTLIGDYSDYKSETTDAGLTPFKALINYTDETITLSQSTGTPLVIDLAAIATPLLQLPSQNAIESLKDATFNFENDTFKVQLILNNFYFETENDALPMNYSGIRMYALVTTK